VEGTVRRDKKLAAYEAVTRHVAAISYKPERILTKYA
jgi:hypothetical protein